MIFHITVLNPRNTESTHGLMGETDIKKIIALRGYKWCKVGKTGWCWNTNSNWGIQKLQRDGVIGVGLEGKEEFAMRERKKR